MVSEEELSKLQAYLVNASKWIRHDGRNYQVSALLQIFVDNEGNVKLVRER